MFNIDKAVEKVKFTLDKQGVPDLKAQFAIALDVSGSARSLFNSGKMQEAFQAIVPLSIVCDKNKELDCYTFASSDMTTHIDTPATADNYHDYISRFILADKNVPKWGGTTYAPVLESIADDFGFYKKGLFGGKTLQERSKQNEPVVIYYFTDGSSSDEKDSWDLLQRMEKAHTQIYIMFIGIGNPRDFDYLKKAGDKFGNVGYLNLSDLSVLSGEDPYSLLIPTEMTEWLKNV